VDAERREISHIVSTGGVPFPGLTRVLRELGDLGATIHIASGDSMRSLVNLKRYGIQPERIHPVSSPRKKEEIVKNLKERYRKVIMVGDGINDIYALKAADLGVLTIQQNTHQPINLLTAADSVISDIQELPRIIMSYLSEDGRS
jgi:Cu+-exporting ATPase